jgi:hypothetical protein
MIIKFKRKRRPAKAPVYGPGQVIRITSELVAKLRGEPYEIADRDRVWADLEFLLNTPKIKPVPSLSDRLKQSREAKRRNQEKMK